MSMLRHDISLIGSFGFGLSLRDGQTIKTHELYRLLSGQFGDSRVNAVDTHGWKKAPWRLFFNIFAACRRSRCIIMLPAHSALKVVPHLVRLFRRREARVFYSVIGAWLPEFIDRRPLTRKALMGLDGIWVESTRLREALVQRNLANVKIVPNFKHLNLIGEDEIGDAVQARPIRLCIFSRIQERKGVTLAIEAIDTVNELQGCKAFSLDIYGLIDKDYETEFHGLCEKYGDFVRYCGVVSPEDSTAVIRGYHALLFPTLYPTEGVPGTIIDAYSAAVPVVSSIWRSYSDVVDEGVTGLGFEQGSKDALCALLMDICVNPERLHVMKRACLRRASDYMSDVALKTIMGELRMGECRSGKDSGGCRVSVIIPTCEPGEYIWKCLDSLMAQSLPKESYEVIIVLNASSEEYVDKIGRYIESATNMRLLQLVEKGASVARNHGMSVARGEHVCFIDDDDHVSPKYLERLLEACPPDGIAMSRTLAFDDETNDPVKRFYINRRNGGLPARTDSLYSIRHYLNGSCMKIMPRSMVEGLSFDVSLSNGEDSLFMFLMSDRIRSVAFTDSDAVYYRRIRKGSATTAPRSMGYLIRTCVRLEWKFIVTYFSAPRRYDVLFFLSRILAVLREYSILITKKIFFLK